MARDPAGSRRCLAGDPPGRPGLLGQCSFSPAGQPAGRLSAGDRKQLFRGVRTAGQRRGGDCDSGLWRLVCLAVRACDRRGELDPAPGPVPDSERLAGADGWHLGSLDRLRSAADGGGCAGLPESGKLDHPFVGDHPQALFPVLHCRGARPLEPAFTAFVERSDHAFCRDRPLCAGFLEQCACAGGFLAGQHSGAGV